MNGRNIIGVLLLLLFGVLQAVHGQTVLFDNFTTDTNLNPSLWNIQAPLVTNALVTNYSSKWVAPTLGFSASGLQMSGINSDYKFTGFASVHTFSPPLTVTATVSGTESHGVTFELLIVNTNLDTYLTFSGNLNSSNDPWYGTHVSYTASGKSLYWQGPQVFPQPTTNVAYTIQLSVDKLGNASALLADTNGNVLGVATGLSVGIAPFYLVLAQREGDATTSGTNIAVWRGINVVAASEPPVQISFSTWQPWTPSNFMMMLQGPIGSNYVIETSVDLRVWLPLTNITSTNAPFYFQDAEGRAERFYRAYLKP